MLFRSAGAGLLFFLLGRKKHHGGGDGGGEEKGDEKGTAPAGEDKGSPGAGGAAPIVLPPYKAITAIRTDPGELTVNNGQRSQIRVYVQLDNAPKWYDVTDNPDTTYEFENGTATLVSRSATEDQYMVTRDQLKTGSLRVKIGFRGQNAEVPVRFNAP